MNEYDKIISQMLEVHLQIVQNRGQHEQRMQNDSGQAALQATLIALTAELAKKNSQGAIIQYLSNGANIHASETVMNDKYEIGQAGAVGRDSNMQGPDSAQAKDTRRSRIDLGVLARQLREVRREGSHSARFRQDYEALAELADAEDAAREGNKREVLHHLARAGNCALGMAVLVDAPVAVDALKVAIKGPEAGESELIIDDNHPNNDPEGSIVRDQYNVSQAGAVGPGSTANHISFTRPRDGSGIDMPALKNELSALRTAMRSKASEPVHDMAVAEVAAAEVAAEEGDTSSVLKHLAKAGHWTLGIASAIGAALAAEVIKKAIGV